VRSEGYDYARQLAADSLADDDPTGWFERLYADAESGKAQLPWGGAPHRLLVEWAQSRGIEGQGRRALVVGCGLGDDAEYVAGLGYHTVAFDVAASAIQAARRRFPNSQVRYVVADLLNPPTTWRHSFALVVEVFTLQVLPDLPRWRAISQLGHLVGPGGTLIVIARMSGEHDERHPPWPLTRAEIDAFTTTGLDPIRIEHLHDTDTPGVHRWRAEFVRPPLPGPPG
jgi:SAM-dependent methyltransferase